MDEDDVAQTQRHNLTIHQKMYPHGYMEGRQDKKPNFGCHQIAELEGTLPNEDDGAQTTKVEPNNSLKTYPHDK